MDDESRLRFRPAPRPAPADIIAHLESLLGRPSIAPDYVRLRIAILRAQVAALESSNAYVGHVSNVPGTLETCPTKSPTCVPHEPAQALLSSLVEACRQHGHVPAELDRLEDAARRRPALPADLASRVVLAGDEALLDSLAGQTGVPADMLVFFGRLLAAPFITRAVDSSQEPAEVRGQVQFAGERAWRGACPACGFEPALAVIEEAQGQRVLYCSLCGSAWPFARLACPFCADQSPSLARLEVEGEPARWIEACDGCRRYLQVIDLRRPLARPSVVPLVEEAAGVYLDLIAQQHGYLRKPVYAALR